MLLDKDVDIHIKDNNGKMPLDICTDEECIILLKKYEDKKETYHEYVKGNLPLSLTTLVRGVIMKAKRPFMNLKERYLLIDPFQGSMIRYENVSDFPKKPKEITPLNNLNGLKIISDENKAFYMKKELFYFTIEEPNKEIYACKYKETAQKWLLNIKQAVKFAQELEKNPHLIS
jgi:serum/glucocorticoid-regulated kinase 2